VLEDFDTATPSLPLLTEVAQIEQDVRELLTETGEQLAAGVQTAQGRLADTHKRWKVRYERPKRVP